MFPEIMLDNFSFLPNYLRSLPERQRYIVAGNDADFLSHGNTCACDSPEEELSASSLDETVPTTRHKCATA